MTNVTELQTPENVFREGLEDGMDAMEALKLVVEKFPKMTHEQLDVFVDRERKRLRQEAVEHTAEADALEEELKQRSELRAKGFKHKTDLSTKGEQEAWQQGYDAVVPHVGSELAKAEWADVLPDDARIHVTSPQTSRMKAEALKRNDLSDEEKSAWVFGMHYALSAGRAENAVANDRPSE